MKKITSIPGLFGIITHYDERGTKLPRFLFHRRIPPTERDTIEYSEEHDDADVVIRYDGEAFDPTQTDNNLSLLLAKNATDHIIYSYDSEQMLANRVDAQIH